MTRKIYTLRDGDDAETARLRIALGLAFDRLRDPRSSVETIELSRKQIIEYKHQLLTKA